MILEHDHPFLHWDLMLEFAGVLRTWRLLQPPLANTTIIAEPLGDHRLAYLDYEGPVSAGRGRVTRWDYGDYDLVSERLDRLCLAVRGIKVVGTVELLSGDDGRWRFSLIR